MSDSDDTYRTPGQLISALLQEKGWTQRTLAIVLGLDETGVNRLVSDKRPVDAPLAIALEELFGVAAERFLDLQKSYDLAKARLVTRPDPKRAVRATLFGGLPIAEMIKRGWLEAENVRNTAKVEQALTKFFKARSLNDIEILPHAAKKTVVGSDTTPAQLAWLYRVKSIATEMLAAPYSARSAKLAVEKLCSLRRHPEELRKIPRIMGECGIRFLIVESLNGTKIDGVCFWLNDCAPVIGMSMRYDRIDNFWFVLRHELEHVIQGHGKRSAVLDSELEGARASSGGDVPEEERIANAAAAEFCVPQSMLEAFVARKAPFFSGRDVLGFAKTLGVHPGLIAGQIQRKVNRYNILREHLVKVRAFIAPSAMVDGWGDVAPVD